MFPPIGFLSFLNLQKIGAANSKLKQTNVNNGTYVTAFGLFYNLKRPLKRHACVV